MFWLITKSKASTLYPNEVWRLPKGWLDDTKEEKPGPYTLGIRKANTEFIEEAALREVAEEAGVKAKIVKKIDTIKFFFKQDNQNNLKFVTFFLMKYISNLKEGFGEETSEIAWLDFSKAKERLEYKSEIEILKKAQKLLT